MAYAVKYLFKFQSSNGIVREIRVLQDGYSGDVIQRPLGRAPVIKKEQNGGVHGTSLTFYAECHVDQEYIEFYTSDPKEYRVDVYAGSTLLWQGYITPELYSEPDIAPPYDVQVVATDGVGELKLYDFTPQGTVTLRSLLAYLLGYTGLSTDVNLISSLKPGSHGAGALLDMQICIDYLAGKTCYEALTYLLDTLHATVTRWGGAWLLVRETNVTFTGDKVRYFNTSGNSALLAGSVQTLGAMRSAPAWPVGQLSTVIDPAKNKVVVQAPWHPVSGLANSGMTSDTGWTKAGGAEYDATNVGYHFPAASLSALPRISQEIAMSGLRMPFRMSGRFTGVSADLSLSTLFTAGIGFYVTYTTNSATYHLERSDEGIVWKQGAMPGLLGFDDTLSTFLQNFDEDRTAGREIGFTVPPFVQGSAFPAGMLKIYIIGNCARIYTASLDVEVSKGYQDILRIDNGARGEGDEVEIAIGRQTADVAYYQSFLQGLLLDSGSLITGFTDANFTTAMDYLALISRDYALSAALPRALAKGTVYLESSIGMPPLVFAKGGLNYWLETWSWDLYEDELEISARTLPSASLTVQSETILESDGSTVSSGSSGSSGGGSSINPGGGINYFEQDDDQQELIKLKAAYSYLGPKKGLIFDQNSSEDANAHLEVVTKTIGGVATPVLHSRLPFYSDGFVSGGGMSSGGGTGGIDLDAMWASLTTTSDAHGTDKIATGHIPDMASTYGYLKSADLSAYATREWVGDNYLPLSAGSSYPLTNSLYVNANTSYPLYLRGHSQYSITRYLDSSGTAVVDCGWLNDARGNLAVLGNLSTSGCISVNANGCYYTNDDTLTKYVIYHAGNANGSSFDWACKNLTATFTATASQQVVASFTNNFANNYARGIDIIFPNQPASGYNTPFLFGKADSKNNKGTISFGYRGDQSTSNYVGIGFHTNDDILIVQADKSVGIGTAPLYKFHVKGAIAAGSTDNFVAFEDTADNIWTNTVTGYAPNLTAGHSASLSVGKASSGGNIGSVQFYYAGNSNNGNAIGLGLYAKDYILSCYYNGNVSIGNGKTDGGYKLYVNGTLNATTIYQNGTTLANTYLALAGGTLQYANANIFNINNNASGATNNYMYFKVGGTNKVALGYYSGLAFISNEATYARLGINDSGTPQYWSNGTSTTAQTLYHSGNSNKSTVDWTCKQLVCNNGGNGWSAIMGNNGGTGAAVYAGHPTHGMYIGSTLNSSSSYLVRICYNETTVGAGGVTALDITGDGNVGINVTGATERLRVDGGASNWTTRFRDNSSTFEVLTCHPSYGLFLQTTSNSNSTYLITAYRNRTSLGSGGSIAFMVRSDGNVGINNGAPNYPLDVSGSASISTTPSASSTSILYVTSGFASSYARGIDITFTNQPSSGFNTPFLFGAANSQNNKGTISFGYRGSGSTSNYIGFGFYANDDILTITAAKNVHVSGNFTATGAVTGGQASDVRLKTNVASMTDDQARAMILALRPVTFAWNQKATELFGQYQGNDLGFIAQEVELIPGLSKAIGTIFEDYKRLDPVKFIAPMVKVAQNHETRIQQLERELAQVKNENKQLRNRLNMS